MYSPVRARTALAVIAFAAAGCARPSLLPRPRQATYGQGSLPLQGLSIRFEFAPDQEDRAAASGLSMEPARPSAFIAPDCASALASQDRAETLYTRALGGRTMHRFWDEWAACGTASPHSWTAAGKAIRYLRWIRFGPGEAPG